MIDLSLFIRYIAVEQRRTQALFASDHIDRRLGTKMHRYTTMLNALITLTLTWACNDQLGDVSPSSSIADQISDSQQGPPSLCATAAAHVEACVGGQIASLGERCDPLDAELLLETSCEVLLAAYDVELDEKADGDDTPFTCKLLGVGCRADRSCYTPLSDESMQRVIELSDPSTLGDEYDVRYRIETIAGIFKAEPDPRGIFAIVYRLITNNAVESVEEGLYEHPEWTRELIIAFARRYLVNIHGHFTGGEVSTQWKKYYKIAQDCNVGYGRTLGVAIATHLMVDLPYALDDVNSQEIHEEDFILFGEVSLRIFPDLISDMQTVYRTDVTALLKGFFLGDWIDAAYGRGTATTFIYQTVRINAWRNSRNLLKFPGWMVHSDINTSWGLAEVFLATLDASGAL